MSALVGAAALALAAGGCGNDEEPAARDDAAEIAAVINAAERAMADGDAGAVCELLTEEGRSLMSELAATDSAGEDSGCEAGVEVLVAEGDSSVTGPYEARDVDLDPTSPQSDATTYDPSGAPAGTVTVDCKDGGGAGFFAEREGEGWKLQTPICSGR